MIYDIYYISASTKKKKKNQIYGDLRVPKNYIKKEIFSEKDNYVIIGHLNNVD